VNEAAPAIACGCTTTPLWTQLLIEFLKLSASALISGFVAVKVVNRLKARSDYVDKRIDDICSEIRSIANLASDYWMREPANELLSMEAKISAGIRFIDELRVATSKFAPELTSENAVKISSQFFRAVTGNDFGVHNRAANIENAVSVQHAAVRYVTMVRRARLDAS